MRTLSGVDIPDQDWVEEDGMYSEQGMSDEEDEEGEGNARALGDRERRPQEGPR